MKRREQCSLGRADLFHGTAPGKVAFVHFLLGVMVDFLSGLRRGVAGEVAISLERTSLQRCKQQKRTDSLRPHDKHF
jgi:hypothetical protein